MNNAPHQNELIIRLPGRWLLTLLAVAVLLWLLLYQQRVMGVFFLALLLSVAITPPVSLLAKRGISRGLAILLVYLLLLCAIGSTLALLVPLISEETNLLATQGPALASQAVDTLKALLPASFANEVIKALDLQALAAQALSQVGVFLSGATDLLLTLGQTAILGAVIFAMSYFMVDDQELVATILKRFVPPSQRERANILATTLAQQLGRWIRTQALISLYYGVMFTLVLTLLGVPYALTLGVVGAVFAFIPYIGSAITAILAMLVALTTDPLKALWVLLAYMLISSIESHVVTPKLFGQRLGLHPLSIIIALFLGTEFLGPLGALLAMPLLVVLQVLFDHFYRLEDTSTT